MIRASFVLMLMAIPPLVAANTIYKCTDENGSILISNTKVDKNCKPVVSGGSDTSVTAPAVRPKAPSAVTNPSPAGFPRVAEDTQKARDSDRRRILEQELASEQRSLESARKDLADQEAARITGDRLLPYKDRVAQHERNIQAINREISNLR